MKGSITLLKLSTSWLTYFPVLPRDTTKEWAARFSSSGSSVLEASLLRRVLP